VWSNGFSENPNIDGQNTEQPVAIADRYHDEHQRPRQGTRIERKSLWGVSLGVGLLP
jgi:hypothetical protein